MRDPGVDRIADAIERRFPGTTVVITPCPSPDDPDKDWMFDVLHLPLEMHRDLTIFSTELGDELFGYGCMPIMVGGVTSEHAALEYSKYLAGAPARP